MHLPISFDGRANGIAHLALIAKDRAAAEILLTTSDSRRRLRQRRLGVGGARYAFSATAVMFFGTLERP